MTESSRPPQQDTLYGLIPQNMADFKLALRAIQPRMNVADEDGNTVLHGFMQEFAEAHKLQKGIKPDDLKKALKYFADEGADFGAKNRAGETPLDCVKDIWHSSEYGAALEPYRDDPSPTLTKIGEAVRMVAKHITPSQKD